MPILSKAELVKHLKAIGSLTDEKIEDAFVASRLSGESLDRLLVGNGLLTEKQMLEVFSRALRLEYHQKLTDFAAPQSFVAKVPVQFARNHSMIAIGEKDGTVTVAVSYPLDIHPQDELAAMIGKAILPALATKGEIAALINKAYQQKTDVVDEMLEDMDQDEFDDLAKEVEGSQDLLDLANKAPIIKLVNMVLFQALKMRASDIHIQPYEEKLQVRYRIDGVLYDMMSPPKSVQEAIISRIKVMGKMDIAERRLPQDGRASLRLGDSDIDVRISSVPTSHGERIVMRLLDKSARLYSLEELGLDHEQLDLMTKLIVCSHGIVFVTGPTGSGKTTTLYAALKRINSLEYNIMTIEDPVEYHLPGISQIEVAVKKGLSFATGLRHIVRQDPDIIMVGEVRDGETATIAIQSALTGHLVFSTLHTNDSAGAITRLLDLGVEPYLAASSVIGAIAQRLVRVICPHCKESFVPEERFVMQIGLKMSDLPEGKLWRGRGCDKCLNTGFFDRTGIYEVLTITDGIRQQIMNKTGATFIKQDAVKRGLRTLRMDGAQKVIRGITTVEEVLSVTQMDAE
ncbi:MAG: type II secretion system ATPase GspE [Planctomycetota bacterium]|nr:type II secretion system ATPase GspE [Planctomycetota bacterium]